MVLICMLLGTVTLGKSGVHNKINLCYFDENDFYKRFSSPFRFESVLFKNTV